MPVLKHARKKLRQDKKRTLRNKRVREMYKGFVKKAKEDKTSESMAAAFSRIDIAAKHNIIHVNKAARLKASLSRLAMGKGAVTAKVKTTAKKSIAKKLAVKTAAKKASKKSPTRKK